MDARTDWKIEWVIRIVLLVFLIAAVAGLFGGQRSARRATASQPDVSVEVRYWPVMRPGYRKHLAAVVVNRSSTQSESVSIALNRRYLRGFDVQGILPEPVSQSMTPERLRLSFDGLDPGEELEMQIDLYVHRWGRYRGELEVELPGTGAEPAVARFASVVTP